MNKKHIVLCLVMLLLVKLLLPTTNVQAKTKKQPILNKSKITLSVGKSYQLKVKNNKKKVKWSTSSKKIAKVTKKGKVTAVRKGTCRVYAKVSGKKLSCKVVVYAPKSSTSSTTEVVKRIPRQRNLLRSLVQIRRQKKQLKRPRKHLVKQQKQLKKIAVR